MSRRMVFLSYNISYQTTASDRYVSVLTNHIVPHLCEPNITELFQEHGTPPFYADVAIAVLDQILSHRWIGRGSGFWIHLQDCHACS